MKAKSHSIKAVKPTLNELRRADCLVDPEEVWNPRKNQKRFFKLITTMKLLLTSEINLHLLKLCDIQENKFYVIFGVNWISVLGLSSSKYGSIKWSAILKKITWFKNLNCVWASKFTLLICISILIWFLKIYRKKLERAMRLFLYLLGVSFSNREDKRKDCNVSVCKIRKIHTSEKT